MDDEELYNYIIRMLRIMLFGKQDPLLQEVETVQYQQTTSMTMVTMTADDDDGPNAAWK